MTELQQPRQSDRARTSSELDFPETTYVRDIENRVFQAIVVQSLAKIEGIALMEGKLLDNFFARGGRESIKGIHAEQNPDDQSISVRIEIRVAYGVSIPEKADEIQNRIAEDLSELTGLHVSKVHVVFKDIILEAPHQLLISIDEDAALKRPLLSESIDGA